MVKKKVIEEAKYIIENKCTIKDASIAFGCSVETIKKDIAKLKNSEDEFDQEIYSGLKEQLLRNETMGRNKGANTPHERKKRNLPKEDIKNIAIDILTNNLTLDMASIKFAIPKSTLHEALTLGLVDEPEILTDLQSLFSYHKSWAFNNGDEKAVQNMIIKYSSIQNKNEKENSGGHGPK